MKLHYIMEGDCLTQEGNFYSTEVLYKAWRDYIGNKIKGTNLTVVDVAKDECQKQIHIFVEEF